MGSSPSATAETCYPTSCNNKLFSCCNFPRGAVFVGREAKTLQPFPSYMPFEPPFEPKPSNVVDGLHKRCSPHASRGFSKRPRQADVGFDQAVDECSLSCHPDTPPELFLRSDAQGLSEGSPGSTAQEIFSPRLAWSDGSSFTGFVRDGKLHGEGSHSWSNGDTFTGQWEDHKFHGQGVFSWPDGRVYTGQYQDGRQHGTGAITWPDGRRYAGTWRCAQRRGPWEFVGLAKDAEVQRGDWGEGEDPDPTIGLPPVRGMDGTRSWKDGSAYIGQMLDGEPHGHGSAEWPGGSQFTGQYVSGRRSGAGVQTWPDGRRFTGQWRDGERHGSYAYMDALGEVRLGAWDTSSKSAELDRLLKRQRVLVEEINAYSGKPAHRQHHFTREDPENVTGASEEVLQPYTPMIGAYETT